MMQSKRIFLSLLVVVLLTFCTLTAFASAEEAPALQVAVSATCDTAIQGVDATFGVQKDDVLDFAVTAAVNKFSFNNADLVVEFDPASLELVADSVQISEDYSAIDSSVQVENGKIVVTYLPYKAGKKLEGDLLKFSLKAKDIHGDTKVTVTMLSLADTNYNDVAVDWTGDVTTIGVHSYGEVDTVDEIPNDCTAGAKTFRACTVEGCDAQIVLARPNEASHDDSGDGPTCMADQICAREGCEAVVHAKLAHDGAPATCTTDKVCANGCGAVLEPKLGHDATGVAATCTIDKVCARGCGTVLEPKLGHDESGASATCTTDKVCKRENCGVVLEAKLGHDESGPAATCTTDKVCARGCGLVLKAKLGHDETGPDATCTTDKVCARGCGAVLVQKKGHQFGEWTVDKEPTMSATGLEVRSCACGATETRELPEKSSAWLVILIIVLVVVLAGGGFAAYWFLVKNKKATTESDEITKETSTESNEEATNEKTEE